MEFWTPLIVLILTQVFTLASGTACSPANRTASPDDCITAIREAIEDEDRFWFGSEHSEECTGPKAYTIDCLSLLPSGPHSIASLVFWQNTFEVDLIEHFLEVKYTSPPGTYKGCGTTVTRNTTHVFRLDPLSEDAYPPWDARNMPEVTWPAKNDRLYTLIVIDVGFGFTHGIYLNINGSNMATADVIKKYSGPLNFRRIPNPYIFILFEQTKRIVMTDQWMAVVRNPMLKFNVSDFQEQNELKGPIAVNWLLSSYDAYSINRQSSNGLVENCASLVQDSVAVYHSNRPWLKTTMPFLVWVKVHFEVEAIGFDMCCKNYKYPVKSFDLDPIGNKVLLPVETRTGQKVKVELSPNGMRNASSFFEGKHYTLLMVDPDVPNPSAGTNAKPLLHWLMINMAVNSQGQPEGTIILPYRGPAPPDQKPHSYYYLLYEQQEELMLENTLDFDGECRESLAGRCLFDVEKFQTDLNLTLVGATWMTARNDVYTNYTKTTQGQEMDQFCKWTPGYKNPCVQAAQNTDGGNSNKDDAKDSKNSAVSHLVSVALFVMSGLLVAILKS